MRAKDVLLEALSHFEGTIVFVSHDRYFLAKLATRVFEVGGGKIEVFPGNYDDYIWRKQREDAIEVSAPIAADVASPVSEPDTPQVKASGKRVNPIKLRQMQDRCSQLEHEIAALEQSIADNETAMHTFISAQETQRLTTVLEDQRRELDGLLIEWEKLSQTVESNA